ncbi:MAG: hypothetical protein HY741_22735 [Chloroflexi bacterium]|nr:hypothetical protein [Chloroflexota bacterium]
MIHQHITTETGYEFHLYDVNDWQVKYDPVRTSDPGAYWSYLENVALLANELRKSEPVPMTAEDIGKLYAERGISGAEGMTKQYMHGLLCAMKLISHDRAGKPSECNNPNCPGRKHALSRNLEIDK